MCPVVPPGKGNVKIMATMLKADAMARKGTWVTSTLCLTFLEAYIQIGTMTAQRPP